MRASLKLPLTFDTVRLRADLDRVPPAQWVRHFNTDVYEGDWSGAALRSSGGRPDQIYPDPAATEFADTDLLARCDYLREVLAAFHCPLRSVRLLRLRARSSIREHRDYKLGYEDAEVRLHVPIVTDETVAFFVDGRRLPMQPGECWYVNVNLPHRVDNRSDVDRVHLVLDCMVNEWLDAYFRDAGDEEPARPIEDQDRPPPRGSFEAFRALVFADRALHEALWRCEDREQFPALAVAMGEAHGYQFTGGDVAAAMQAGRRVWIERWII